MPKQEKWKGAEEWFTGIFVGFFFAVIVTLPLVFLAVEKQTKGWFVIAALPSVVLMMYVFRQDWKLRRQFECPGCKRTLRCERITSKEREIRFLCQACDTIWHTGIRQGEE